MKKKASETLRAHRGKGAGDVPARGALATSVLTYLENRIPINRHEHVALLRRGREQAFRLAPFIAEGLRQGDRCCYLAPKPFHHEMLACLREARAAPDEHLLGGRLRFQAEPADERELQAWTRQVFAEAELSSGSSVRWVEEGIWPKPAGLPLTQIFEFHALLNYQVKHCSSVALCQYDTEQLEIRELFSAIAVHRHLVLEETLVRDNPFYIPAEKFIPLSPSERERDLLRLFREVGFDVQKLLAALAGYGQLQGPASRPLM